MSKDIAIGKKLKISEAQQYMLLATLGAGVIFGVCLAFVMKSLAAIEFNARVLKEENDAISAYSKTIENIGLCKAPKGDVYTEDELKKCNPNSTPLSSVPNTLRANILEGLAANEALSSVPISTGDIVDCINKDTEKRYTYEELNKLYNEAEDDDEQASAMIKMKSCSALRVIPNALPAQRNEEALLASVNNIFYISGWTPESLTPSGYESDYEGISGLNSILATLTIESETGMARNVLSNIERSIREFGVETASLEWKDDNLFLTAQARAYYVEKVGLNEVEKTVSAKVEEKGQK